MKVMKKFEDLQTADELKKYLDSVLSRKQPQNYYHYTKLTNLLKIYETGKFKCSQIKNMNDRLESELTGNCSDYFTCLMGSSIESFGMWAMYGGIGAHLNNDDNNSAADIYVKIKIPVDSIKSLVMQSNGNIALRQIAYTNLNAQLRHDLPQSTVFCGTVKNNNKIDCLDPALKGYVKDNAWSYEKEVRLVSKEEFVDISSILNTFRIIPSPAYSIQKTKMVFRELKKQSKLLQQPVFEENEYYNLIM